MRSRAALSCVPMRLGALMAVAAPALFAVGCPPFSEEPAFYLCRASDDCGSSAVCHESRCCVPKTCPLFEGMCGTLDDGCGGQLICGCSPEESCGLFQPNRCGCSPQTCDGRCGEVDDACGGKLACACTAPQTCGGGGVSGMCGCTADTCGDRCGRIPSGCGGTMVCPDNCDFPEVCGGGEPNLCGARAVCANVECGLVADPASGRQVWCASCETGEACEGNLCVPARRPFCWGPPQEWTDVEDAYGPDMVATPVVENGELFLYVGNERLPDTDPGCRRHARVPLLDWTTANLGRYEPLQTTNFDDLSENTCYLDANRPCRGKVSAPRVSNGGLEMIFDGNYPCYDWEDNEIYVSTRPSVHAPWSKPEFISRLSTRTDRPEDFDGLRAPLLMPDNRMLLYRRELSLEFATRATDTPGDRSFTVNGAVVLDDLPARGERVHQVTAASVSCDGEHLIYLRDLHVAGRDEHLRFEGRIARIISINPTVLGPARPYDVPSLNWRSGAVTYIAESPDCSTMYYSTRRANWFKTRVACAR